ncbi:MAG TPA: DUF3809 domain-containing protein [Deinococcales bacterium]|nr:DUF3809 domain-containing protein [Deinococcales bacterium]
MRLEVERDFTFPYPGDSGAATDFLRDVRRSLARVPFIRNLSVEGDHVTADLAVDVPFLGEQLLDFSSRLVPQDGGADLVAEQRSGRAWAEVSGSGRATPQGERASISYHLRVVVHLELPAPEKWGGRAFSRMAEATAARTLERVAEDFPAGVMAAMP